MFAAKNNLMTPITQPTIVGSAIANTSSVTIPAHQIGDMIIVFAMRASSTTATKPAASGTVPAWVDWLNTTGTNGLSIRVAYFVATATNTTTGTWTNSSTTEVVVLRGQDVSPVGGSGEGTGTSNTNTAPAITLVKDDGSSALIQTYVSSGTHTMDTNAPAGYVHLVNEPGTRAGSNAKLVTTTAPAIGLTMTASVAWRALQIEVLR